MRYVSFTLILVFLFAFAKAQDCDIATTGVTTVNATNTAPLSSGDIGQVFNFKFSIANFGSDVGCTIPVNSVNAVFDFPTLAGGIKPYVYNGPSTFSSGYFTWTYNSIDEILEGTNTTAIPNGQGDANILVQVIGYQTAPGGTSTGASTLNLTQTGATSNNSGNDYSTAQLTIFSRASLHLKVLLQGGVLGNIAPNVSIMRDNLRNSTFTGFNYIPKSDPYVNNAAYSSLFTKVGDGTNVSYQTVLDSATMFADRSISNTSAVDWIFIELRSKTDSTVVLGTRSAIVQQDGTVVDIDGSTCIKFPSLTINNYFVSVRHRNHLGAMTSTALPTSSFNCTNTIDFTTMTNADLWNNPGTPQYDGLEMATLSDGKRALWAGNSNVDIKVKYQGGGNDRTTIQSDVLAFGTNINFDNGYGYFKGDVNMDSKAKYQGSGNDRTLLQSIVLGYLLNTLNVNFDLFLQQLP